MANDCFYSMKVVGSKDSIKEFIRIIGYKGDRYLSRIFEAVPSDILYDRVKDNWYTYIGGDCAWSVYCCMLEGKSTYYDNRGSSSTTSLIQESENLKLKFEVYSEECGMGFQEHYIIEDGEVLINETVNYSEWYYDDFKDELTQRDIDKFNEKYNTDFTLEEYNSDKLSFVRGGFDEWEYVI